MVIFHHGGLPKVESSKNYNMRYGKKTFHLSLIMLEKPKTLYGIEEEHERTRLEAPHVSNDLETMQ